MNLALQLIYLALFAFYLFLLARLVCSVVVQFSRRWEPGPKSAALLETVYSVTDPPLKGLRKVIPPLRLGTVSIDLAFLALLLVTWILMDFVVGRNISLAALGRGARHGYRVEWPCAPGEQLRRSFECR